MLPRSLCLEDWKKLNPEQDEKKFAYYWRKLSSDKKQVCRILPSLLILSDTSDDICQPYLDRAEESVRHCRLRYSS